VGRLGDKEPPKEAAGHAGEARLLKDNAYFFNKAALGIGYICHIAAPCP
jgi:hypothetical protein